MHGVEVLRRRPLGSYARQPCASSGLLPYAPQCRLYLPVSRVEDDDAAVAVAVGDVHFVRCRVLEDLGGPPEVLRVVAAVVHALLADLQQELPGLVELQDLRVGVAVAANPDVALVIDRDAVVALRPFVALCPGRPSGRRGCLPDRTPGPAAPAVQQTPIGGVKSAALKLSSTVCGR